MQNSRILCLSKPSALQPALQAKKEIELVTIKPNQFSLKATSRDQGQLANDQQKLIAAIIKLKHNLLGTGKNPLLKDEFNQFLIKISRKANCSHQQLDYEKYKNEAQQLFLKFRPKSEEESSVNEAIFQKNLMYFFANCQQLIEQQPQEQLKINWFKQSLRGEVLAGIINPDQLTDYRPASLASGKLNPIRNEFQIPIDEHFLLLVDLSGQEPVDAELFWRNFDDNSIHTKKQLALNFYKEKIFAKLNLNKVASGKQSATVLKILFFNQVCYTLLHDRVNDIFFAPKNTLTINQLNATACSFKDELKLTDNEVEQMVLASLWINLHYSSQFKSRLDSASAEINHMLDRAATPNDIEYIEGGILSGYQQRLKAEAGGNDLALKLLSDHDFYPFSLKELIHQLSGGFSQPRSVWERLPGSKNIIQDLRIYKSQQFILKVKLLMLTVTAYTQAYPINRSLNSHTQAILFATTAFKHSDNGLNYAGLVELTDKIAIFISLDELEYFRADSVIDAYKLFYVKTTQLIRNYLQRNKIGRKKFPPPSENGIFHLILQNGLLPYFLEKGFFHAKTQQLIAKKINSLAGNKRLQQPASLSSLPRHPAAIAANRLYLYPVHGKPSSQLYFLPSGGSATQIDIFSAHYLEHALTPNGISHPRTKKYYPKHAFMPLNS